MKQVTIRDGCVGQTHRVLRIRPEERPWIVSYSSEYYNRVLLEAALTPLQIGSILAFPCRVHTSRGSPAGTAARYFLFCPTRRIASSDSKIQRVITVL